MLRDQKCRNADNLFILAHCKNETVYSGFYVMCCVSIYYIFLNLSKDAENPANLTSFVVACSIGNTTIQDLQDYVKVTIKHTKIQVRQDRLFRWTVMHIIYSKAWVYSLIDLDGFWVRT